MQATPNPVSSAPAEPTPAATLRHAALYLQRYGWTRGSFYDWACRTSTFPPACAVGAIGMCTAGKAVDWPDDVATDEDPGWAQFSAALTALAAYLGEQYPAYIHDQDEPSWQDVWRWNDAAGNTDTYIIGTLNNAAIWWEQTHFEEGDETGCEGHESLAGQHMGATVFCDGSCRGGAR